MQKNQISPVIIAGFLVAFTGMAGVGWWLSAPTAHVNTQLPIVEAKQGKKTESPPPSNPVSKEGRLPEEIPAPGPQPGPCPPAPQTAELRAREDADQKIGTILLQNPTPEGARDRLLTLFSGFSSFEKIAAAPHIVNLVTDDRISKVVDFLKSPLTPVEAQETFFNDMLNRPPQVGWPVLVDVIAAPNHPLAQRAKELLTTIVGGDHGNDVAGWTQGIRDQMKLQGVELPGDS